MVKKRWQTILWEDSFIEVLLNTMSCHLSQRELQIEKWAPIILWYQNIESTHYKRDGINTFPPPTHDTQAYIPFLREKNFCDVLHPTKLVGVGPGVIYSFTPQQIRLVPRHHTPQTHRNWSSLAESSCEHRWANKLKQHFFTVILRFQVWLGEGVCVCVWLNLTKRRMYNPHSRSCQLHAHQH